MQNDTKKADLKVPMSAISHVIEVVLRTGAIKATKYLSDKQIVRATRTGFKGGSRNTNVEITLTLGRPNFAERASIKACKKAKEPFPIKKAELKFAAKKKAAKKSA